MASFTLLSALAVVLCLGLVQCQSNFEFDNDRDFRGRDRLDRGRDEDRDLTLPECAEKEMDIFFVLDSSTSIWQNDVERERQFVRDVVRRLDVGARATRVGILTFSDDITRPVLGLNSYQIKSEVLSSINEDNLPYRTGITNTDQAIRYVRENTEFRQDITKVIVVITDGGSRSPGATAREADFARNDGFYMLVVGVGQYLDEREWRAIATDPDENHIFNITNFQYLSTLRDSLPTRACLLPPLLTGSCQVGQYSEVYFTSATPDAFLLLDHFMERTSDNNDLLRMSIFMDACNNAENIPVTDDISFYCERAFEESLNPTTLRELLSQVRTAARESREQSRGINRRQVAVLFVDEDTMRANRFDFQTEARNLERDGVTLVVVDLGVRSYVNNLQNLAADRDNYIRFQGGSLVAQERPRRRLVEQTCQSLNYLSFVPRPSEG